MNNNRVDKTIEELMKVMAEDLIESRRKYAEIILDDSLQNPPYYVEDANIVSASLYKDTSEAKRRHLHKNVRWTLKRVSIVAATLVLIMGMVLSVSEAARLMLYNAFFKDNDNHYVVMFGDSDEDVPVYEDFIVEYIPEGYTETIHELSVVGEDRDVTFYAEYQSEDKILYIEIVPRKILQLTVDNEEMIREEIFFHDIQGEYYHNEKDSMLMWSDGKNEYIIAGGLNLEEYISIAERIKGVKR